MTDDFDAAFAILDAYGDFALLTMAYGQAKICVTGDVAAYEVEEYLYRNGVRSDCWTFSAGIVVCVAGADEPRARALLENWANS